MTGSRLQVPTAQCPIVTLWRTIRKQTVDQFLGPLRMSFTNISQMGGIGKESEKIVNYEIKEKCPVDHTEYPDHRFCGGRNHRYAETEAGGRRVDAGIQRVEEPAVFYGFIQ